MKIFSAADYPQGSPQWWELRRGILTASNADKILTPKTCKPSAQMADLLDELIGDLVNQSPNWFSENRGKPPNRAVEEGVAREAESRNWFGMAYECEVLEVGFCLSDCGRMGFSPDGLVNPKKSLFGDYLVVKEGLELKNPMHKTQVKYLREKTLPPEYKCQVHMQLLVGDLDIVHFCSYSPPLPPFVIRAERDKFTEALAEAVEQFHQQFAALKKSLGLPDLHPVAGEIVSPVAVRQDEESYPF